MFLLVLCTLSCSLQNKKQASNSSDTKLSVVGADTLIGKIQRSSLEESPHAAWFTLEYNNYTIDRETIKSFQKSLLDYEIAIFMGTWCSDSQREVPAFFKILDEAGFASNNVSLIAVSEFKDTPEGFETGLDIVYVPTFIFKKKGIEINRIVESPVNTLEKDILSIVNQEGYKHIYSDF